MSLREIIKKGLIVIYYKEVGQRIKALRENHGMTQEELGAILGVQKAAVAKIESGKNANITIDKLMIICKTFNAFPASLLYGDCPGVWTSLFEIDLSKCMNPLEEVETIAKLHAITEKRYGPKGAALLKEMNGLNEKGVERALSYINDLTRIEEYSRSGEQN